ncbi:FliM/FliN family flagellar motor C-terminal domain-containing protein [Salipiger sp.]|uniref:FliM/FliN family flagellar motor switch protein n=1 Tax=Salipiger sp. TaxID=2078585 RepID=UPI003A972AE5
MGEAARQDVLGQKATAARRAFEARAMSPAKALRRALSRTADVLWDLALVTHGVSQEMLDQDGVIESLAPDVLLLLLDGPDGAIGLAAVDREVMTGLIEIQTILQVTQMPVEDRPLTQTDAAMMGPLIDGTMTRLTRYLEEHPLLPQLDGFRYGAMVEDARTAALLLDAASYRMFRVSIDLALGRRRGDLLLIMPERPGAVKHAGVDSAAPADEPGPHERKMKLLPVRMDAVLGRISLPLKAAQALKPGDLLPLKPEAMDGVTLQASYGVAIAGGRLGQMNGMRAVRITWPEGAGAAADDDSDQEELPKKSRDTPKAEPDFAAELAQIEDAEEVALPADAMTEELPDLPSMAFDSGDFDLDAALGDGPDEGEEAVPLDFDFAAAPLDLPES